ncbi:MAG: cache domain-containing protein, partial [Candidatus Odinarchaeota archaeon]
MARSIKQNIILSFTIFSLISIVIVGAISVLVIGMIGQTTVGESTNALEEQIQRNMEKSAEQNAKVINQKLSDAENMVEMMAEECEMIFSDDNTYQWRRSYYDYFFQYDQDQAPAGILPSNTYKITLDGTEQSLWVSWNYASYYFPGSTQTNYDQYAEQYNDTLGKVSNMDYIFSYIHENAPDFRWLYVVFGAPGTSLDGLFINYPGSIVGGSSTERVSTPFEPTGEEWYAEVLAGNGNIVFTAPYFDPIDGVLLITIGRAIYYPNGTAIGIIAGDLSIESVKDKILDVVILESGYAALIQEDGTVVAHQDYDPPEPEEITDDTVLPGINDVEVNKDKTPVLTAADVQAITSGNSGLIEYTRDKEQRFLAYHPVGKGDYICLIVVPVSEAIAAVKPLQDRIGLTTLATIAQVVIIIAATGIISVLAGFFT